MFCLAFLTALAVDFELPDHHGRAHALRDWNDKPIVVVAFLGAECPVARLYAGRLNEIQKDFGPRGVAVVGVDANPGDSAALLAKLETDTRIAYPLLRDVSQTLANRLNISRQPEIVVLDRWRVVRYRGRIDDQYSPSNHKAKPTRHDLRIALEELLANKPVSVAKTEPAGCPLERLSVAPAQSKLTYHRDVAPILNQHCVTCHRPEGIAPFSLRNGADAVRWSRAIREAVADRRMPPWHADPRYGQFANNPSLSETERRTIEAWATGGASLGDDKVATAPPRNGTDGRTMHATDLVVSMPQPFSVPASGILAYQEFEVDPGFQQDMWVQEAEIRPRNRAVVHHSSVYLRPPGMVKDVALQGELGSFCLCAYTMGTPPLLLPDGMAKKIPAGWRIVFVMHYVTTGTAQTDQTSIALKLLPANLVRKEVATNILLVEDLKIPPRCPDYVERRSRTFDKDVLLLAFYPHMHLRGVSFQYDAQYPDGRTEILLSVPKWDLDWQHRYVFAEPKLLPAGTVLSATAHYDNSDANPNNPDPDAEVRTGPQTTDEMFNGYYEFCLADQDLTQPAWRRHLSRPVTWVGVVALIGVLAVWRRIISKNNGHG